MITTCYSNSILSLRHFLKISTNVSCQISYVSYTISTRSHVLKQMFHTWIAVASCRIERIGEVGENIADNGSEHDEILDAAIRLMEHTLATRQKIGKGLFEKRAEQLEIVKGELFILK